MNRILSSLFISIATAMLIVVNAAAQTRLNHASGHSHSHSHTEKGDSTGIPKGIFVWNIDERFGTIRPTQPDTLMHLFQNTVYTEGRTGSYNTTGNLGSPRISRIYSGVQDAMMDNPFIFTRPYDAFLRRPGDFVFTNTRSPLTRITYHSAGNKTNGDDSFRAEFASNINRRAGIGFVVDYVYGRGFYTNQAQSSFGGSLYGSYRGDQYQMHAFYNGNHLKNVENGGLEDEAYITNPESFPTSYRPADMPVRLSGVRNRMNVHRLFLTHRYSVGFYEYTDSLGKVVHRTRPQSTTPPADTTALATGQHAPIDTTLIRRFVPVAGLIHTFRLDRNDRRFSSTQTNEAFFQNSFYTADNALDDTRYLSLQNTLALELQEGFRPWVKTGMRLFAKHELARFTLPDTQRADETTTFNYFTLGAQLLRRQARTLRYDVLGEMRTTGEDWGEFNLEGNIGLNFHLAADTLRFTAGGFVRNENPAFYYEHFHGRNAWWDKDLDKIFRFRLEGALAYRNAFLRIGLETVQNHVFFQETQTLTGTTPSLATMKYGVEVAQTSGNLRLLSATLGHRLAYGIFHWENEWTIQQSSDDKVLPLPLLNVWSNAYLKFKLAHVLDTELGADVRYFTNYYAPAYSPILGMYALQDANYRTKVGNYPWINAYVNFALKGVRFYLAYSHVNSSQGRYFLAPHYPTNQRVLRLGICWTFFN